MEDEVASGSAPGSGVKDTSHLMEQNLATLKVEELDALTPEVISRQATINVGTIGHVAHGKSTIVRSLSGVQTVRFKNELERNITIKLGYANAKIFRCQNPECPRPECYTSYGSLKEDEPDCQREGCGGKMKLQRHLSFVDCPGHDILMATMLNGAAVMDAALLLVAANETCPQPQTSEHLAAIEIMRLQHVLVLQNKIDLIKESAARENYEQILKFIKGTVAQHSPVIPLSAQLRYNVEVVCEYLCTKIPKPVRDFTSAPHMIVIRSFDVNRPGASIDELKGGIAGGSITKGVLRLGDEIEIRPGIPGTSATGKAICTPIRTAVLSLYAEENDLQYAVPGGLIGVGTQIDPCRCRADGLVGQVLGREGTLPEIFSELEINFFLLRRLLGVKTDDGKQSRVQKLAKAEVLMVNIGSTSVGGKILDVKNNNMAKLHLLKPVCTAPGEKVALSRRVDKHWRLVGWATITRGTVIKL